MKKLKGLIAAPFTPLDERGELALGKISTLARSYEKNHVSGAFICGSTGEGVAMSHEEKKLVMEAWGKEKGSQLKAVFMLGGNCLKEIKELAALAPKYQMDGISILCPYYFKPASVDILVEYCKEVAMEAPDLPFYYYHIPALTNGYFSMLDFLKLAEQEIPNLAGIKYSHPNIMEFHSCSRYNNSKFDLLWGVDEGLLSGLAIGARGAVGSTYNYAAPLYTQVMDAFEAGDLKRAEELQFIAVQIVEILVKYGGTGAGKAIMKLIGLDCGWFRQPLQPLSDSALEEMKIDLDNIGFFDVCSRI